MLFFPPAGAGPGTARPLATEAAGLRFGVLSLPGRGSRSDEPSPADLGDLASDIARSVSRLEGPPPVLAGHSFGGLLAFAVASQLEAAGHEVGLLVTVASTAPAQWHRELVADPALGARPGALPRVDPARRDDFVARRTARVLGHGGVPHEVAGDQAFVAEARRLIAVDIGMAYRLFPERRLVAPITAVWARDDTVVDRSSAAAWSGATTGPFASHAMAGDHFFYRAAPRPLMALLRMECAALDSGWGGADPSWGFAQGSPRG